MTTVVYIQKRIENLEGDNRLFARLSISLIVLGLIALLFPFIGIGVAQEVEIKYAEFGFGCISFLVPLYLSGERSKRRDQILSLQFLLIKEEKNPGFLENDLTKTILERL